MSHSTNQHHNPEDNHEHSKPQPFYKSLTTNAWVSLGVVVVIILFYLLTHHKTHVFDVLPYILVLAMILMHVGGHGGHNHGGKRHE